MSEPDGVPRTDPAPIPIARRLAAEAAGTGLLVAVVVGSGIQAQTLSRDVGLALLENALATAGGLFALILIFGPVSGAHFNPVVSLADWWVGRSRGTGLSTPELGLYIVAQIVGGILGSILANVVFAEDVVSWSTTDRSAGHLLVSEVLATAGLLLLIFALVRSQRTSTVAAAVGAYIGAAYWFTSSTSFANPAVTIARAFSDTFAGIQPSSVPMFVVMQLVGLVVGLAAIFYFYPDSAKIADNVVVPHADSNTRETSDR
jgi:glycerol uptake facilitator-like aquaporin